MRVGDITALPLSALHWNTRTIAGVQQKTGRAVQQPIWEDVGWAIMDYLKHGRPPTASPVLFVRHQAPFEPFQRSTNLHNLITKYTRRAGIAGPTGRHGMHALRHTLARTLLEHETPLPVIADILGACPKIRGSGLRQETLAFALRRCLANGKKFLRMEEFSPRIFDLSCRIRERETYDTEVLDAISNADFPQP